MLRIRLARRGRKKKPSYRVVVVPSRATRDGRVVEDLGHYDPTPDPSHIQIDVEEARKWIQHGAQPSDRVWKLFEALEPGFRKSLQPGAAAASGAADATPEAAAAAPAATGEAKAKAKAKAKSKAK